MKTRYIWPIALLLALPFRASGQGELADETVVNTYEYHLTYGIFGSTNGWRVGFQYRDRYNRYIMGLYEAEFGEIRHIKELKILNPYYQDARRYSFGKDVNCYVLRLGFGTLNQMYGKFDKGSVSVHYHYSLGPSIALLKPVYYEILYYEEVYYLGDTLWREYTRDERINIREGGESDYHTIEDIKGRSSYFKGFDKITTRWGAYAKAGFAFDYSTEKNRVHSIEVGAMAEGFTKAFEIMDNKRSQFFFSLYLGYRFGHIRDKTEDMDEEYID